MANLPPDISTYHCICNALLLASTHTLSTLPRRQGSSLDEALILPLPSAPPMRSLSPTPEPEQEGDVVIRDKDLPSEGYTILLGLVQDKRVTIIRREDGFERRLLSRCARCNLVVGYDIQGESSAMDVDGGSGKEKQSEHFSGKIIYLLPSGITSTDVMVAEKHLKEENVTIQRGGVTVFE